MCPSVLQFITKMAQVLIDSLNCVQCHIHSLIADLNRSIHDIIELHIANHHHQVPQRRYQLFYALYVLIIVRLLRVAHYASEQRDLWLDYRLDLWIYLLDKLHTLIQIDSLVILLAIGVPLFAITLHYVEFYKPDPIVWSHLYDLTVYNQMLIKMKNRELFERKGFVKKCWNGLNVLRLGKTIKYPRKLRLLPSLSLRARVRVLRLLWLNEFFIRTFFTLIFC